LEKCKIRRLRKAVNFAVSIDAATGWALNLPTRASETN